MLKHAMLQATGPILLPEFFPHEVRSGGRMPGQEEHGTLLETFIDERLRAGSEALHAETIAFMERNLLTRVLRHTQGNQSRASKILGITRGSLRGKIRMLGITINQAVHVEDEPANDPPYSVSSVN